MCVFVIVYPCSAFPVGVDVYPSGTPSSTTVYAIFVPSLFTSKSSHVCDQLFSSFNVTASPAFSPSAFNCTVILSGLIPSWLSLSSHTFVTLTSVFATLCVFVIVYPSSAFPVVAGVYPVTASSVTVYDTSLSLIYFGKFINSYFQFPSSSALTIILSFLVPFSNKLIVILSGLIPS